MLLLPAQDLAGNENNQYLAEESEVVSGKWKIPLQKNGE
jgi:hypothetical protein